MRSYTTAQLREELQRSWSSTPPATTSSAARSPEYQDSHAKSSSACRDQLAAVVKQLKDNSAAVDRYLTAFEIGRSTTGVLERESDPEGQLYKRTKKRMTELEKEYADTETRLHRHVAATPPEQEGNAGLLDHLPLMEVDLNLLPADRLRRFLEAFRAHYDLRTGRATFKAEISAETVSQLAKQASRADATLWQPAAATADVRVATNEEGPAKAGGSRMIKGSSFSKCPRDLPIG